MTWMRILLVLTVMTLGLVAVESSEQTSIDLGRGPVTVHIPASYDPNQPVPLLMLLHNLGGNGAAQEAYIRFLSLVDEFGFVYLYPDGTADSDGYQFWNATDACCDFYGTGVDDSGYLLALIDEVKTQYSIDPGRVFLFGHSNGAFMSYRMACDHSGVVTAIASLSGATFFDPDDCQASLPVHVLQINGRDDESLLYEGGCFDPGICYPGAIATVERWASRNGCSLTPTTHPDYDLSIRPGADTNVLRYRTGCLAGGSAELWTINNAGHSPMFNFQFNRQVINYFYRLNATKIPRSPTRRLASGP